MSHMLIFRGIFEQKIAMINFFEKKNALEEGDCFSLGSTRVDCRVDLPLGSCLVAKCRRLVQAQS